MPFAWSMPSYIPRKAAASASAASSVALQKVSGSSEGEGPAAKTFCLESFFFCAAAEAAARPVLAAQHATMDRNQSRRNFWYYHRVRAARSLALGLQ